MWELQKLTSKQIERCKNTISSNAFYFLVGDALVSGKNLSVVRMGDGERILMDMCNIGDENDLISPTELLSKEWLERMGVSDIPKRILKDRILSAAKRCDYFCPSISGINRKDYFVDDFSFRAKYVDNFFLNSWNEEMKIELYKKAGHVLFIHRNTASADALQLRAKYVLDVKVTYLKLTHWSEADSIIKKASEIDAPLTIFSGGSANKILASEISKRGRIPKVVLDIGNTADSFLLPSLKEATDILRYKK